MCVYACVSERGVNYMIENDLKSENAGQIPDWKDPALIWTQNAEKNTDT